MSKIIQYKKPIKYNTNLGKTQVSFYCRMLVGLHSDRKLLPILRPICDLVRNSL
jgi:hypothetical protein